MDAYDADGNRLSKTTISGTTTSVVNDAYQSGQLVSESDGSGTLLATFTYDVNGTPSSVQVGSDLTTAPRYYYSYNGHGDVVDLTDANGSTVATYSYDTFGVPTIWETFTNGWHNPFLYDGRDGARYDSETGLYWLSVRAYDPTLGRFISRDPLGRTPLFFDASQPYVYAGNNPINNVDPSGQFFSRQTMDGGDWMPHRVARPAVRRVQTARPRRMVGQHRQSGNQHNQQLVASMAGAPGTPGPTAEQIGNARDIAMKMVAGMSDAQHQIDFYGYIAVLLAGFTGGGKYFGILGKIASWWNSIGWLPSWIKSGVVKIVISLGTAMGTALAALYVEFEWIRREFLAEAGQSDAWWRNLDNINGFYNRVEGIAIAVGILGFVLGALIAVAGVENPLILGFGAGLVAMGFFTLFSGTSDLIKQAVDQEKLALGW